VLTDWLAMLFVVVMGLLIFVVLPRLGIPT
jgi:hypothetical protein